MENPLLVFVSSVIGGMEAERKATQAAIQSIPLLTRPWLFEFSSASSLPLAESYLSKVRACDIFVVLLKDKVSDPVKAEVRTAQAAEKPILAFLWKSAPQDVVEYAHSLGVKCANFENVDSLSRAVTEAVADELIRGYREHHVAPGVLGAIAGFLEGIKTAGGHTVVGWVVGSGAVAQNGSVAAGAGGIAVGRGVSGDIHVGERPLERKGRNTRGG